MLNPKANEFKPGQFGPPSTETSAAKSQLQEAKPSQQQQQQHSKRRPPKTNKPQQNQQKQQKGHVKSDRRSSSDQHQSKKSNRSKNQQQAIGGSGSGVGGGRRHKGGSSSSTQQQQQQSATSSSSSSTPRQADNDSFGLLTKFITIEEAIDPVFRTRPTEDGSTNLDGGSSSTGEALGKLIHGYERYIEWISRCLRAFETVTIVGMDYAIADVVSLVTILQRRNIGEHEEVETFAIDQGNKRYTSGIQVKVHLCT